MTTLGISALSRAIDEQVECAEAPKANVTLCEMSGTLDSSVHGAGMHQNDDGG